MTAPEPFALLSREELLGVVAALRRQHAELQRQMAALTASQEALRTEIDPLKRGGKR